MALSVKSALEGLGIWLLCLDISCAAHETAAKPLITAAAVLPRQDGEGGDLLGYELGDDGDWHGWSCSSESTLTLSGKYGACKATTRASMQIPTGCSDGSVLVFPTSEYTCTRATASECVSIWLNGGLEDTIQNTVFGCYTTSGPVLLFRETTIPGFTFTLDSSLTNEATSTDDGAGPVNTDSGGSGSSSSSGSNSGSGTKRGRAWIAGPAIGGVVVLAAAIWFGKRLWNKKSREAGTVPTEIQQNPPPQYLTQAPIRVPPQYPTQAPFPNPPQYPPQGQVSVTPQVHAGYAQAGYAQMEEDYGKVRPQASPNTLPSELHYYASPAELHAVHSTNVPKALQ